MSADQEAKHIVVVDDEEGVRTLLKDCFELEGFSVSEASSGSELEALLAGTSVDLITLDVGLGGDNGFDVVRDVRSAHNVPIVMISGKGDTIDRVVGLELGADDYITKPFQLREVVARVRAVIRRYESAAPAQTPCASLEERYAFGECRLNVASREFVSDGASRELTTSEFDLLTAFVRRPGRVLSRDNLMDILKGHEWSPLDRSIDALIVRLRRKVEPEPTKPQYIKTVRGIGYVFAVPVSSD